MKDTKCIPKPKLRPKYDKVEIRRDERDNLIRRIEVLEKHIKKYCHLCTMCYKAFGVCDGKPKFGNGMGNDNVYKCKQFVEEE